MDRALKEKQSVDKQRQDRLISSISSTLTTAVNTKLDKLVRSEMKSQVVPGKNVALRPGDIAGIFVHYQRLSLL